MRRWLWVVAGLAVASLGGCSGPAAQPAVTPTPTPVTGPSVARSPAPTAGSPAAASSPTAGDAPTIPTGARGSLDRDALVARAVADAAARTGVAADAIRVVQVEAREWPNSALGCEKPGMGYAQVITPGYRIVLEAGGRTLQYHTDRARAELCAP